MLTREIAQAITQETMKTLGRNINIMDSNGIILSSGVSERIDSFHEAALQVIKTKQPVTISKDNQGRWQGAEPGVNLPITFENKIIGVVGISGPPEDVQEFGAIVVMMTELMIQRIYLLNQVEWHNKTHELLLEELVSEGLSLQKVQQKTRLLNIQLTSPYQVIVVSLTGMKNQVLLNNLYPQIRGIFKESVYGFIGEDHFVLLVHGDACQTIRETIPNIQRIFTNYFQVIKIAISKKEAHLEAVSNAYKECCTALNLINQDLLYTEDFKTLLLIHKIDQPTRQDFKQDILKNLTPELETTLNVFFENNFNISQTAKQLFIHRNTLLYRIDKVKEITGYDPKHFKDAATLQLAMWMHPNQ